MPGLIGRTPFPEGLLAGSDPVAAGEWGCPAPFPPAPIEACRDGGSLPATSEERGSTPALRWPWRNRKRASDMDGRDSVRPNGGFVSGDPQSEPDTQDLPPPPASGAQNRSPERRLERHTVKRSIIASEPVRHSRFSADPARQAADVAGPCVSDLAFEQLSEERVFDGRLRSNSAVGAVLVLSVAERRCETQSAYDTDSAHDRALLGWERGLDPGGRDGRSPSRRPGGPAPELGKRRPRRRRSRRRLTREIEGLDRR